MAHYFESGFFVRQKAWHGLGTVLENAPIDTAEAIRLAGLDWQVEPMPVFAEKLSGEGIEQLTCPRHRALVRSTDGRVLSVMGKDYTPLQNSEAFRFFEPFLHEGDAHLEAAGSLRGGRTVWVLAKVADSQDVADGDVVNPYLLLSNSHDGSSCVKVAFTAIRVVCWNTLSAANTAARCSTAKIRHTSNVERNVKAVRNCIDLARQEFDVTMDLLRGMRSQEIQLPQLHDYVRQLFGSPKKLAEIAAAEALGIAAPKVRGEEEIERLFLQGPGHELAGSTVFGAYNAVTHYLDHVRGRDNDGRLHSTWFGQGANVRAEALRLAGEMV